MNIPSTEGLDKVVAEHNVILGPWCSLLAWRGSVAHGTYRPNTEPTSIDDKDLMGIVVPGREYTTGLRQFGSRGTLEIQDDPWDVVIYEYRKAINLLTKGNPNILCLLWMPQELYIDVSSSGSLLLENRDLFATQQAAAPFRGYAKSQMEKMVRGAHQGYMGDKRKKLVEQFGYDTKNASHLIRILRQGIEFLSSGDLQVVREDADELLEIKRGEKSLEWVKATARLLDVELSEAVEASTLPEEPDLDAINRLAVTMEEIHR